MLCAGASGGAAVRRRQCRARSQSPVSRVDEPEDHLVVDPRVLRDDRHPAPCRSAGLSVRSGRDGARRRNGDVDGRTGRQPECVAKGCGTAIRPDRVDPHLHCQRVRSDLPGSVGRVGSGRPPQRRSAGRHRDGAPDGGPGGAPRSRASGRLAKMPSTSAPTSRRNPDGRNRERLHPKAARLRLGRQGRLDSPCRGGDSGRRRCGSHRLLSNAVCTGFDRAQAGDS